MTAPGLAPDRVLGDRYRLIELVATGGMGEVWRARDEMLERDVAIKALKREYAEDETFLARFRAEAKHTAGLTHPGIAAVYDFGEDGGTSYLVMELVPGEPLSAMLRREGRLDVHTTLTIVGQAALALHAAHAAGVIHRDIKPGNLLITPDLTTKVSDFGIAWAAAAVPLTLTGTVLGTAHYLSPEQGTGDDVTPASDVYSLGVVAYECLAGQRPFDGDSAVRIALAHVRDDAPELPPDIPEDVRTLVAQALAKDPTQRFTTAAAFARAVTATQQRVEGSVDPVLATVAAEPTEVIPLHKLPVAPGAPLIPPMDPSRTAASVQTGELPAAAATGLAAESPPRRTGQWLTVVGIALVLVLIAAAIAVARSGSDTRALPSLVGMPLEQAQRTVESLGLDHRVTKATSRTVGSGSVLRSDPEGPGEVSTDTTVVLVVSAGPAPVTLPDGLIGRPERDVVDLLTRSGVVPRVARVTTGRATPGTVIDIVPGSGLREGQQVVVTVAVAPARDSSGDAGSDKGKGDKKKDDDD